MTEEARWQWLPIHPHCHLASSVMKLNQNIYQVGNSSSSHSFSHFLHTIKFDKIEMLEMSCHV